MRVTVGEKVLNAATVIVMDDDSGRRSTSGTRRKQRLRKRRQVHLRQRSFLSCRRRHRIHLHPEPNEKLGMSSS